MSRKKTRRYRRKYLQNRLNVVQQQVASMLFNEGFEYIPGGFSLAKMITYKFITRHAGQVHAVGEFYLTEKGIQLLREPTQGEEE